MSFLNLVITSLRELTKDVVNKTLAKVKNNKLKNGVKKLEKTAKVTDAIKITIPDF